MDVAVEFEAGGIRLAGTFYTKDGASDRSPGIVLAHGFAGVRYPKMAAHFADLGYGVLSLDFRGYGESGGERGRVIPHELASDIRHSVTWLSEQPGIDPSRIGVVGSSLGGSVAIMACADDDRVKVCVAGCPLGRGDATLRMLYDTEDKFTRFIETVDEKKRNNQMIARYDIVQIPEKLRAVMPPGTPMEFTADTVYGFLSLNSLEVVSRIAPRPLFIIHAEDDHVVPVGESRALAVQAGDNCDLHVLPAGDHFIFGDPAVAEKIGGWLVEHLPAGTDGA